MDSASIICVHGLGRPVLYLILFICASGLTGVLAQNSTAGSSHSFSRQVCPSGFHCFNNSAQTVVIDWGHNGHLCLSQDACYGEADPLGFVDGPRQFPQTVIEGDTVIFKPDFLVALNVRNVSKHAYDQCIQSGQLVHNSTMTAFQVPGNFLNPPGIKYFINPDDPLLYSCSFGIKLELNVRSRGEPSCTNQTNPQLGVCSGKGLCVSDAKTFFTRNYSCLCMEAYHGKYCQELNSCDASRNPCKNGATCIDIAYGTDDVFNCSCLPGYDGIDCGNDINECASSPCKSGGFCSDEINKYTCLCQPGFEGDNCEDTIPNACASEPCENGGTCQRSGDKRKNYTCICPPNFTGRNCTVNITSTSIQISSIWQFQTSMLYSTSLVHNRSHTTPGSFSTSAQGFTSSVVTSRGATMSSKVLPSITISPRVSVMRTSSNIASPAFTTLQGGSNFVPTTISSVNKSLSTLSYVTSATTALLHSSSSFLSSSSGEHNIIVSTVRQTSPMFSGLPFSSTALTSVPPSSSSLLSSSSEEHLVSTVRQTSATSSGLPFSSTALISVPSSSLEHVVPTGRRTSPTSLVLPFSSTTLTSVPSSSAEYVVSTGKTSPLPSGLPLSLTALTSVPFSSPMTSLLATKSTSSGALSSLSTVFLNSSTSTFSPSRTSVSVLISSSTVPTLMPPVTTPSLRNKTCDNNPCYNNGTCSNEPYVGFKFRCTCRYPTVGPLCINVTDGGTLHFPAFGRNSYLKNRRISFNSEINTIDITFKTNATEGLLLFAADHKKRGDFIQLLIVNGKLQFRFDPGDSAEFIQSNELVNTGQIVTATVSYVSSSDPPFGTLQVDNGVQLTQEVHGKLKGIQLYDNWYVGGVPSSLSMHNETKGNAVSSPSFVGSIRDVQINGEALTLADAVDWFNINEGDLPACQNHPCENNGECVPHADNVHDYTCRCTAGFTGRHCESHLRCLSSNCTQSGGECIPKDSNSSDFVCLCPFGKVGLQCKTSINITVPLFSIVQNVPSFLEYQVPRDGVSSFHITFQFKVDNSSSSWNDSLLVYSQQNEFQGSGDDFFAVGLKNDKVLFQFNLGSGAARIYSDPMNASTGWHLVVAGRDGRNGYLYVDNQSKKEGSSPGSLIGLNLFEPLYIGGIRDTRQLPSVVDFRTGGFHGSIYDAAIRFSRRDPFISLTTLNNVQDPGKEWAVVRGRNVGNESYDECTSRNPPCANGGNCTREGATFLCSCPKNWAGLYCTSPRVPCYGYDNPCITGTCRQDGSSVRCDCPWGKTGQHCDQDVTIQTPFFQSFSYMRFERRNIAGTRTTINIRFKPATQSGVLFYAGYSDQSDTGDFMSIYLHNGFVKLKYNLGSGVGEAKSNLTVSLNSLYSVNIDRTQRNATLTVAGDTPVSVLSPGSTISLDVPSSFFLGGVPLLSAVSHTIVDPLQDFSGCIELFQVNGIQYVPINTGPLEGRNIANCPSSSEARK